MSRRHELHAFDYVNRPYAVVRDTLFAGPLAVFREATAAGARPGEVHAVSLRAKAGPFTVGQDVELEILAIEDGRAADGTPGERFVLGWKALRHPGLFPQMRATLRIYPLTPTETQLDLEGTYDPPLGWLGDAVDALALHKVAEDSVAGFVRDVAAYLRAPAAPAALATPAT